MVIAPLALIKHSCYALTTKPVMETLGFETDTLTQLFILDKTTGK